MLAGRTPLQTLLDDMRNSNYMYLSDSDSKGRITALFFAHNASIQLAQHYHHVILMDCTYKMNIKYRLPLLHVVGMTSFNSQYTIGFCFLKEEKKGLHVGLD